MEAVDERAVAFVRKAGRPARFGAAFNPAAFKAAAFKAAAANIKA
jgi:hypothetical protein